MLSTANSVWDWEMLCPSPNDSWPMASKAFYLAWVCVCCTLIQKCKTNADFFLLPKCFNVLLNFHRFDHYRTLQTCFRQNWAATNLNCSVRNILLGLASLCGQKVSRSTAHLLSLFVALILTWLLPGTFFPSLSWGTCTHQLRDYFFCTYCTP